MSIFIYKHSDGHCWPSSSSLAPVQPSTTPREPVNIPADSHLELKLNTVHPESSSSQLSRLPY